MKLLHTSDWHLGMVLRGGMSYAEDQRYAINEICKIAVNEGVDGILLSGDVFDKSIASGEALRLYDEVITHICVELNIPIYIIAGNHDGAERLSALNELLKRSGLNIAGSLTKEPHVVRGDGVDIFMLPWISTDKVRAIYPEQAEEIASMEDAYRVVLDSYRASFVEGHQNILLSHAFIFNAETSVSDRAAEVGRATQVSSAVFDGFDYVALGHLHAPQSVNKHIRYSGSLMAYSFGKEEGQQKSVTIIDTADFSIKVIPISQLHRRITLKGTYDELMRADYDQDILDGYVRLEITDSYVGMDTLAAFRERYKNLLEISGQTLERDDGRITMSIDELENSTTTPEEVFSRYCKDMLETEPSPHLYKLFESALRDYDKETVEE